MLHLDKWNLLWKWYLLKGLDVNEKCERKEEEFLGRCNEQKRVFWLMELFRSREEQKNVSTVDWDPI